MITCFSRRGLVKKSKFLGIEPRMEGFKTIFFDHNGKASGVMLRKEYLYECMSGKKKRR